MSSYADEAVTLYLGEGALAALLRARNWQGHPLGQPNDWPQALKTALQIMLASPMPSWLCWGAENILFYNDAGRPLIGVAHPEALAQPAPQGLALIWGQVAPALAQVSAQGQAARLTLAAPFGPNRAVLEADVILTPIANPEGRTAGVLCTLTSPVPEQAPAEGVANLQSLQHKLLELTLQERPLTLVLDEMLRAVQSFVGTETACSLLLTNAEGDKLHHGAAVGLAEAYCEAIDGIAVGPAVGSCGTSAYSGAPVHVADIATDPLWTDFRDLALAHGLRACWSHPIVGTKGRVLGTFAIYSGTPSLPSQQEDDFLDLVARITALILERYAAQEALNDHQRLLETLNRTGAGVAAQLDHAALVQMVTDAGVELTGAQFGAFFYNVEQDTGESYMLYALSGVARSAFSDFPMLRNTKVFAPTFAGDGIVRSDDITADPRYGKNDPYYGMPKGHLPVRSYLAVPVISRSGEVLGGLFFGHADPGRFSAHHEKLMDGLAGQAATALDNAHLYSSAQREIQERKRAEADLIKTKNDLELTQERVELALAAGAIVGTWIWHIPSDSVTADERFARAFGLDFDLAHNGLPIAEVAASIHPEDWDRVNALIEVAVKEGSTYRAEYRARHADGTYRWVEANGYCEHDADGQPIRFPGVLIDIEKRRRIESDLKRREADLALLLDATADGFYAVDTEGYTTRCNASFLRMLGFDKEKDVIGKQLHEIIHHSHADGRPYPHEHCPIYRVASNGGMAHVDDEVFFRTDGTSFPVEYWVRPVVWQDELQGAVCNIVDISERKRAEEARQLLMRELDHRVKNLFSITAGMIKMTARHAASKEELSTTLSGRVMALARAHELISSSISAGRSHDAPSQLHTLIEVVMEPHAKGREHALELDGPTVNVGPTATTSFALILHELATNAAKYGALSVPEGRVRVHWATEGNTLSLTWVETGGPAVTGPPQRSGFGSQLARLSATGQLGGTIDHAWNQGGVEIKLTALMDRLSQ